MKPENRSLRAVMTAVAVIALVAQTACVGEPKRNPGVAKREPHVAKRKPHVAKSDPSLAVGDIAPAIDIEYRIKGEEVDQLERGRVYVLEFWATWCGPCRSSIPHLSELQRKYKDKDVVVIGVSREPLDKIVAFLKTKNKNGNLWSEEITYTLTTDPDRSVSNDYMKAAGQRGIPTAFIIGRDGRVEWIGHPMRMDDVLEAVVSGAWDRSAGTKADQGPKKRSRAANHAAPTS